ncbi:DUF1851 domain-containing protein [Occallatibacter riparius]|uniref:DUF1851 domain-containing protein n=1 Tax=Occallatibacter riparius TaxID=1002689 RepID=A0A9J7BN84_9BACT|nr:DUF1851 domain-containing protein [Occallatibacter riparius]UWZ84184.1 DUF1851 domain-containing protein [Occallatibacter riparius]
MLLTDYLIEQKGKDWTELLSDWVPPLPSEFTVWMVNLFGDVFAVFEDGSVHLLNLGTGVLERLADSLDHFCDLVDQDDNADNWLMISLADACRQAGLVLSATQCYSFRVPPILGGSYEVENVAPCDLSVHFSFMADIVRQTKDLPDGASVHLVVQDLNTKQ